MVVSQRLHGGVLFVFIASTGQLFADCPTKCKAVLHEELNDYSSPKYTIWTHSGIPSKMECSGKCLMDSNCHSFIANPKTQTCVGYAASFTTKERVGAVADTGAQAYLMCTAPQQIGHSCSADGDCTTTNSACLNGACSCPPILNYNISGNSCNGLSLKSCGGGPDCQTANSVCIQNKCQCDVGYSYNPSDYTCVQVCGTYGTSFTSWGSAGIDGCNNMAASYPTAEQCWQSCASVPSCRNAEYWVSVGTCNLCFTAWFQLGGGRNLNSPGWIMYTRNCE